MHAMILALATEASVFLERFDAVTEDECMAKRDALIGRLFRSVHEARVKLEKE